MTKKTPEKETEDKAGKTGSVEISASKKMNKGDQYLCEICALSLHVDECGEFLASKGPNCCGHPMKKTSKLK